MLDQQSSIPVSVTYLVYPGSSLEYLSRNDNSIPYKAVWWIYIDIEQLQEEETSLKKSRLQFSQF